MYFKQYLFPLAGMTVHLLMQHWMQEYRCMLLLKYMRKKGDYNFYKTK